jgi:hypothetical protein
VTSGAPTLFRERAAAIALAVALACVAGGAPPARAAPQTVLDGNGASVAAYGGWAAWSRADASTGEYALVTRSPAGVISLPAVAERSVPFDVELGPVHGSAVAAVYSRCSDARRLRGCHIALLPLGAAPTAERALAPPGGGSDHQPAIWNGRLAFLRRNLAGDSRRPDSLLVWNIGAPTPRALVLPRSRGNAKAGWPAGLTGRISGLGFNGKQLAYVTSNVVGDFGESTLWFQPLNGRPELIDQVLVGAGSVCPPEFLSPVLAGPWLYAYLHACDPSANPRFDRLTRYRHGEVQKAVAAFIHTGDEAIGSVVVDGAGVDWDAAGIERLAHVSWRRITAPIPQTFCSRADPFC